MRDPPSTVTLIFGFNDIYNKVFTFVKDRIFTDERQTSIVSVLQTDQIGYMQEYVTMETYPELGYFDYFTTVMVGIFSSTLSSSLTTSMMSQPSPSVSRTMLLV